MKTQPGEEEGVAGCPTESSPPLPVNTGGGGTYKREDRYRRMESNANNGGARNQNQEGSHPYLVLIKDEPKDEDANSSTDNTSQQGPAASSSGNANARRPGHITFAPGETDQIFRDLADTFTIEDLMEVGIDRSLVINSELNVPKPPQSGSSSSNEGNIQQLNERQIRMEQLFSSRISSVATAPRRSTVTPSFIQRNMSLYTQLTTPAPKTQSDLDQARLAQHKWMEYPSPNPSVAPSSSSNVGTAEGRTLGNTFLSNGPVAHQAIEQSILHPYTAPGRGNNFSIGNPQNGIFSPSINVVRGTNNGAQNGTSRPTYFNDGNSTPGFVKLQVNPSNGNSQSNSTTDQLCKIIEKQRYLIQELRTRLTISSWDCYEQKMMVQFMTKSNKELQDRLRCALHDAETSKYQQMEMQSQHPLFYNSLPNFNMGVSLGAGNTANVQQIQNQNGSSSGYYAPGPATASSSATVRIKQEPEVEVNDVLAAHPMEQWILINPRTVNDASRGINPVRNLKRSLEEPNTPATPTKKNKKQSKGKDGKSS